jgi:hypothetical protein
VRLSGSTTRYLGAPFYNLLEYLDKVGSESDWGYTGLRGRCRPERSQRKSSYAVDTFENASQERINLMARIIAETAVKEIFWKILELECKHQDKPKK